MDAPPSQNFSASGKQLSDLVEKRLAHRIGIVAARFGELLQLFLLRGIQSRRHFDDYPHVLVAPPVALDIRDTFAFEPENCATLGAGGNLDGSAPYPFLRAVERGHFDLATQCRGRETDGHIRKNIVAVACEEFMGSHMEDDVKVAGRTTAKTTLAVATATKTGTGFHARGNSHLDLALLLDPSFAAAFG